MRNIRTFARIAEKPLHDTTAERHIVPMPGISLSVSGAEIMRKRKKNRKIKLREPHEMYYAERCYLTALSFALTMRNARLITKQELSVIDTILLDLYRPSLSGLLSGKSLQLRR